MKQLMIIALAVFLSSNTARSQESVLAKSQDQVIEKFADYPGGLEKMYDYVRKNLKYPEDALRDSITGDVFVEFIVDVEGKVVSKSVKVIGSVSRSCDEEAVRLIKNSPAWIPARSKRGAEEQYISFPVSFRLP